MCGHFTLTAQSERLTKTFALATVSWDHTARVWDAATGRELLPLRRYKERVIGLAFTPDGRHLATASYDNTVKVWEVGTGRERGIARWSEV